MDEIFWGIVSVVGGVAVVTVFDLTSKQALLVMALVLGIYVLSLMWNQRDTSSAARPSVKVVDELLAGEGILEPEEARKWLDELLVQQQEDKQQ